MAYVAGFMRGLVEHLWLNLLLLAILLLIKIIYQKKPGEFSLFLRINNLMRIFFGKAKEFFIYFL